MQITKKVCCLIGGPGIGKGTSSTRFCSEYPDVYRFSVGDELRKTGKIDNSGNLVGEEVVKKIVVAELSRGYTNYIFDGYPRSVDQAKIFYKVIQDHDFQLRFIHLKMLPIGIILERLNKRHICTSCGHIGNTSQLCAICNTKMTKRADDLNQAAVERRLELYTSQVNAIYEFCVNENLDYMEVENPAEYSNIEAAFLHFFRH